MLETFNGSIIHNHRAKHTDIVFTMLLLFPTFSCGFKTQLHFRRNSIKRLVQCGK